MARYYLHEFKEFKEALFRRLDTISEYHPDLIPQTTDSLNDLLEKYFYWAKEYNAGYFPEMDAPTASHYNQYLTSMYAIGCW